MLRVVNDSLFSFESEGESQNDKGHFWKTSVMTTPQVEHAPDPTRERKETSVQRNVLKIVSPEKEYTRCPVSVRVIKNIESNYRSVLLRISDHVPTDRPIRDAEVYVIAFPFTGIVKPLEVTKQYRIHKGLLVTSDSPSISFQNHRYRKVMYLVVQINPNLFEPDHEHHLDEIPIVFESYSRRRKHRMSDNEDFDTIRERMTVTVTRPDLTQPLLTKTTWERGIIDEVDMTPYKDMPLYVAYEPEEEDEHRPSYFRREHKEFFQDGWETSSLLYETRPFNNRQDHSRSDRGRSDNREQKTDYRPVKKGTPKPSSNEPKSNGELLKSFHDSFNRPHFSKSHRSKDHDEEDYYKGGSKKGPSKKKKKPKRR